MKRAATVAFPDALSLESTALFDPAYLALMREASAEDEMDLGGIDPYHVGLTQAQIDALEDGTLSDVDHMLMDCGRGYKVIVGFCERQQENNADRLRRFIREHPEFTFLIQPILEYDPEYGGGEIYFWREGDKVKALISLISIYEGQKEREIPAELTYELFRSFLELTEPFGCFMANNGEFALNFG